MITIVIVGRHIVESVTQNIIKREKSYREGESNGVL